MNELPNGKRLNLEKPVPGCLGRMVNLFDLSMVAKNRLLTDKPHSEGIPLSRSQSDVVRTSPSGDQIEGNVVYLPNKKPNGTPMKMLMDQEMSEEIESVHNPPSVVAKLMGLDALPHQKPNIAAPGIHYGAHSRSHSDTPSSYWNEDGYLESELEHEFNCYPGQKDCIDINEIWQKSRKNNCVRNKSPSKGGRYNDLSNEKKMALVRQKFMEAKRLATDEKLRQSKQFQEALEVLSSNKDSFLKFLQEPNSLFSQHLYNMQSIPPPPETKRITVLRPSKMVDNCKFPGKSNEKHPKKTGMVSGSDKTHIGFSPRATGWKGDEHPNQPTRIVLLKPSPGRSHDLKFVGSSPSASPRISHGEEFFGDLGHDIGQEPREVAKSIAQQMHENLGGHRRDETLISSVFSNGYIGDESSFNKSETEYAAGNLTDSEAMSPASRHSWDYINRLESPLSSSFSRASYSPESSVCREAKKRLSERWASMASNGGYQEPKCVRRSSNTLGEMLALSDIKKAGGSEEVCTKKEEPRASSSAFYSNFNEDNGMGNTPTNFLRSKSVPVSSTQSGMRLNVDISDLEGPKSEVPQYVKKEKTSKSSFKGKVSSLFFSRNRKTDKGKSSTSQFRDESCTSEVSSSPLETFNDGGECNDDTKLKYSFAPLPASSSQVSSRAASCKQVIVPEAGLSMKHVLASGNPGENQDQPSPISVLEPPFGDDECTASESSFKADRHGIEVSAYSMKSNLIDKSPPIGSIARTLSWDDCCVDMATSYPLETSLSTRGAEEEEEWLLLVQTLLLVAGIDGEVQSNLIMSRWHSCESPLDPSLRDKYIDLNEKEILQEAKRRQRQSMQKLVFDCVNAALIDIAGYGSETCQRAIPYEGSHNRLLDRASIKMVDRVWALIKDWCSGETRCVSGDSGDINSLAVERVVRKELMGKEWGDHLRLEIDNLGVEIETKLLDNLVEEAVVELAGWC